MFEKRLESCYNYSSMKKYHRLIKNIVLVLIAIGLVCCHGSLEASDNDKEQELLFVAQKALEDGFYDVSLGYLERFLVDFPQTEKRAKVYLLMGQCYLHQNQFINAVDVLDKILELPNVDNIKDAVYYWKAEVYFRAKDYAHAKNFYREVLLNFPDSEYADDTAYSLGWCFFEEKDYEQAIESFNKLIELYPASELIEDARFKTAEALYSQKKYKEAEASFLFFIKKFPKSKKIEQAYFFKAESSYYLEDYPVAIKDYKKVSQITSSDKLSVLSKTGLGWSYLMLKKFTEAEDIFEDAQELASEKNMGLDSVLLGKASLFAELGQEDKSLSSYEELISEFPESPLLLDAYLGKANSLYKQAKYDEALGAYEELLERLAWQEDFSDLQEKVYFGIAWTNLKLGRSREAIKEFQNIIERTSDKIIKISALSQLGDVYQEAGQLQKAVDVYDSILNDYPDSFYGDYVQFQLAITLLKMDNIDVSILALQSLKLNYPKSKFILDSGYYLGLAYFNKGDLISAKEQLQSFIDAIERNHELRPQAMQLLGLSFRGLESFKESADIFERLTKEYSDNAEIANQSDYEFAISLFYLGQDKEGLKRLKLLSYNFPQEKIAEDSLLYIADYYLKRAEYDTARRYFQKIISEYPNAESIDEAHYGMGQSYFEEDRFDEAIEKFDPITSKTYSKLFGSASLAVAEAYANKGDLNSAIRICRELANEYPELGRASLIRIGDYFKSSSKYNDSLKAYEEALSRSQGISNLDEAQVYFKIAELYEETKDLDKAIETYLKVAYLSSDQIHTSVKSYLRAARIFEDKESWQEAKKLYEKIANEDVEEAKFAEERIEWIKTNINN